MPKGFWFVTKPVLVVESLEVGVPAYRSVNFILVGIRKEVVGEMHSIAKALKRRIHEAGIAQVIEAGKASFCFSLLVRISVTIIATANHGSYCTWEA